MSPLVTASIAGSAVLALLLTPHLLPRSNLRPGFGVALFLALLAFRSALVLSAAAIAIVAFPSTAAFAEISSWCFHAVVPYLSAHLGVSGHAVGHAATLMPALTVSALLISATLAARRATHEVRRWIRSSSIGSGPGGSLIVAGSPVVLATTGLRHPQVLVSAGALLNLDERELNAGLEHERGHVRRGHRFISVAATALHGCCRLLPGSGAALEEIHFHVERDADEYARKTTNDPAGLARAILKAAAPQTGFGSVNGLGGADVADRLQALQTSTEEPPALAVLNLSLVAALSAATAGIVLSLTTVLASSGLDVSAPLANLFSC